MTSNDMSGGRVLNPQYPNYAASWTSIVNYNAQGYPLYRLPNVMPSKLRCAAIIPTGSTSIPPAV